MRKRVIFAGSDIHPIGAVLRLADGPHVVTGKIILTDMVKYILVPQAEALQELPPPPPPAPNPVWWRRAAKAGLKWAMARLGELLVQVARQKIEGKRP